MSKPFLEVRRLPPDVAAKPGNARRRSILDGVDQGQALSIV